MEQIRLGDDDWLDREVNDTRMETLLEDGTDALFEAAEWPDDTRYDEGWQRAGGESFYRIGHDAGDPVFIQKSGNPRQTLQRGQNLDNAGAVVIPTVMMVESDAKDDVSISGGDYTIVQDYVPDTFMELYKADEIEETAIEDLGRNAAALDKEGYRPVQGDTQLKEMLSDGERTYMVDFGADIGASGDEPRDDMYEACIEELDAGDYDVFETGYEAVRGTLPDVEPEDIGY